MGNFITLEEDFHFAVPRSDMDGINWKADISLERSIPSINWDALKDYAISIKYGPHKDPGERGTLKCEIPPIYSMGGLHLVRLLAFEDGAKWVARIQLRETTPDSTSLLLSEMHTLSLLRERTDVPVPRVFGYDTCQGRIGRAFMIIGVYIRKHGDECVWRTRSACWGDSSTI